MIRSGQFVFFFRHFFPLLPMLNVLLLSSPLLTVVAGQMSQSECVRLASYCTGNQTVKPMQILPNDQLCAANVTAYCDDTCAKMAPYKACMEPLRTDCFRYGGPNALLMQMDRLCNSSEPLCTGCCATGASKPVVKTPAQLTCEERQEYCDDLVSSLGTTAGCQGCVKFSLTVACRSADAKCAADDNWKAVTDVTLRGCSQLKGFCGDCCGLDVTVNSTCGPNTPPLTFVGIKSGTTVAGATTTTSLSPGGTTASTVSGASTSVVSSGTGASTGASASASADATGSSTAPSSSQDSPSSAVGGAVPIPPLALVAVGAVAMLVRNFVPLN
jgi:hypothetical protein